jgi:transcriptional regulator with XRE-family HTH domain
MPMVTQSEIARQVGLDVSSVNKILNRIKGPVFREATIKKVFKLARQLGYSFERLKHRHARRHPRNPVSIRAEVSVYSDGVLCDTGEAMIRDFSASGARIDSVRLGKNALPLRAPSLGLKFISRGGAEPVELRGQVVRLLAEDNTAVMGVQFSTPVPELSRAPKGRLRSG